MKVDAGYGMLVNKNGHQNLKVVAETFRLQHRSVKVTIIVNPSF